MQPLIDRFPGDVYYDIGWSRDNEIDGIEYFPRRNDKWRDSIFKARELYNYSNYLRMKEQSDYYTNRWYKYLTPFQRKLIDMEIGDKIFKSDLLRTSIKLFEKIVPQDKKVKDWLKEKNPDVLVVSGNTLRYSEEQEYLKAAKCPTVAIVLSWDNLTTKGTFHIMPDKVCAWNEEQIDILMNIHGVPKDRIELTGAARFEIWGHNKPTDRKEFLEGMGMEDKPYIVYLGSSSNIRKDETYILNGIAKSLDINILLRPHQANRKIYTIYDAPNVYKSFGKTPGSKESIQLFYDTLYHSVGVIGLNNSAMIDAMINDKAVISPVMLGSKRTQLDTMHYRSMMDGMILVHKPEECLNEIVKLVRGQDDNIEARRAWVKRYIRPNGDAVENVINVIKGVM